MCDLAISLPVLLRNISLAVESLSFCCFVSLLFVHCEKYLKESLGPILFSTNAGSPSAPCDFLSLILLKDSRNSWNSIYTPSDFTNFSSNFVGLNFSHVFSYNSWYNSFPWIILFCSSNPVTIFCYFFSFATFWMMSC